MLGFYVFLGLCAGVVVLVLVIAKRGHAAGDRTRGDRIAYGRVYDYVEEPAREAWKFTDTDWQREAEQWLANNKYEGLPEFRSAVARKLAAVGKDHYSETMQMEFNEAFKEFQQDRKR